MSGRTAAQWRVAGSALVREWETTAAVRAFLLRLTHDDLEAVSRVATKDDHPLHDRAIALLRAVYAID